MLPAHIAANIRKQTLYYLQSTFAFRDPKVDKRFEAFLTDPEHGLFKGPWVTLRRPYRPAPENVSIPFGFGVDFHPFRHQYQAWKRLSSRDDHPESTIITSGTGSGKTECFLFPILDHCLRMKAEGQRGIKAIILYPMNALAADQEKRFAQTVFRTPALRKAGVTVGTYTGQFDASGDGAGREMGTERMAEAHGISHHETLKETPPDILLTNYKMLDFLLLRPDDRRLWRFNAPGVLRYLVLDELHTYDGAQGSDVACLVRRLKERLGAPRGALCCVGTSATLETVDPMTSEGDGEHSSQDESVPSDVQELASDRLARFASRLFEESIPTEAVFSEERLEVEEIVRTAEYGPQLPEPEDCLPLNTEDAATYAMRQAVLWGAPQCDLTNCGNDEERGAEVDRWTLALGDWLKATQLFRYLLELFREAELCREEPLTWQQVVERLALRDLAFAAIPENENEERHAVLVSFFALVAEAREERSGHAFPLVPTQVQMWTRELRRLGRVAASLGETSFCWLDEPPQRARCLPAFHCSECGESGWIGLHDTKGDDAIQAKGVSGFQLADDSADIYRGWFRNEEYKDPRLVVMSPWNPDEIPPDGQDVLDLERDYLCSGSLVVRKGDGPCPVTGDTRRFRVRVNRDTAKKSTNNQSYGDPKCPRCGSRVGVFFIGSQAATLASVAIDELFGSTLNNDPKLLAFTDSVQDASHRAGFFSARTYRFTFRTALQHVIDAAGADGLPLLEVGSRLLEYWGQPGPERCGSVKEAMATLMPPDLREYGPWLDFRDNDAAEMPSDELRRDIEARLCWEAVSEFGLMQTHGRTMEPAGSAAVGWREEPIEALVQELHDRLEGISPALTNISSGELRLWTYGMLQRFRERGALYHPYLDALAKSNQWGKYPFGNAIPGRETYPSAIRYKPHLLVTQSQREHEFVLASTRGSNSPWHIKWARRVFNVPGADETALLDLIQAFLKAGTETGVLRKLYQEGQKGCYALNSSFALLFSDVDHLKCSETGRSLVRPVSEAKLWCKQPSLEYYADFGRFVPEDYSPRQRYYQDRYRKGALRRVVAQEHTGLLQPKQRKELEARFARARHRDDPNVLTCTSTLEMGIDIGDLSSTMLCAVPPSTASYLQRIGRAGRKTGTALILSIVNQRPHDLFFYTRPDQMLKGRIEPPGCWLDAAAVLVRQYLAYCIDSATANEELAEIPVSAKRLIEDLKRDDGQFPKLFVWMTRKENALRDTFLKRFGYDGLGDDTRDRFLAETQADVLANRIHQAARDVEQAGRHLETARQNLQTQLKELDESDEETRHEIQRELRILRGRITHLNRTHALEILTDHGLLPNYAFPERGVRFYGAVYNRHRDDKEHQVSVEITRPAGSALKELAPANVFYTLRRQFDIQQIAVGSRRQALAEQWGICGKCGHMRKVEDMDRAGAAPSCPQCGHGGDSDSQFDSGQRRQFIEFANSQALSYMEHYDSLSGDRSDERRQEFYQLVRSLDQTVDGPVGAVVDEGLPFGIEYRASMVLRDVNVGYYGAAGHVAFGPDVTAPDEGFQVCQSCGIVLRPNEEPAHAKHRRSCAYRRGAEKRRQEGKAVPSAPWESIYLYRELRSEAIRLLLPLTDDEDIDTLSACIYLGLRLRFEGNPAHLIVAPQIIPDPSSGIKKHYLVLMDAVPGGTGYLKSLYQEKDASKREGEGIMDILRRALVTMDTCACRKMSERRGENEEDPDGCYRCIRTYRMQYNAETISRERGIQLLRKLIDAGDRRVPGKALEQIKADSLFGSVLEKKFIDRLREFVENHNGQWEKTIIKGGQGFRFSLPHSTRLWEVELQPALGIAQGVDVQSQPDFLLRCDDSSVKPVAVFADGFQYHCSPCNRLADDMNKRRAIHHSGAFRVWSITWEDLEMGASEDLMVCDREVRRRVELVAQAMRDKGKAMPDSARCTGNGFQQLTAFLDCPIESAWSFLAGFAMFLPLQVVQQRTVDGDNLREALAEWQNGENMPEIESSESGQWVYNSRAAAGQDALSMIPLEDIVANRFRPVLVAARLPDDDDTVGSADFPDRWRRFLACLNLYQFCRNFEFWTVSESVDGFVPDIPFEAPSVGDNWRSVIDDLISFVRPYAQRLATAELPVPTVEYYCEEAGEDVFAELAWPDASPPTAILVADQETFADKWRQCGWKVISSSDLQSGDAEWLVKRITESFGGS